MLYTINFKFAIKSSSSRKQQLILIKIQKLYKSNSEMQACLIRVASIFANLEYFS